MLISCSITKLDIFGLMLSFILIYISFPVTNFHKRDITPLLTSTPVTTPPTPYPGTRHRIITSQISRRYNASSGGISVFAINDYTRLNYSYAVNCLPGYYGNRCSGTCTPRQDSNGHYTCHPRLGRQCLDGWTGEYCQQC